MPLFSPHYHDEMEIIYIVRGDYEIYHPDGNYRIGTGTVYLVPPNEIHSVRSLCDNGEYLCLEVASSAISMNQEHFFQRGFVEPLQTGSLHLPRMVHASEQGYEELFGYMKRLRQLKADKSEHRSKLFIYTMGVCMELMPHCSIARNDRDTVLSGSDIAKKCVQYMHEHYSEKLSLAVLAEYVHVHPNYLCAAFKKDVGLTVLEYLNRIRVERARDFLRRGDLNIGQVAEQCGFRSLSAFQRTFKANTGISPSGFAKRFKK